MQIQWCKKNLDCFSSPDSPLNNRGNKGAQEGGWLKGSSPGATNGKTLHRATVMLGRARGGYRRRMRKVHFRFTEVPPGVYDVVAYLASLTTAAKLVEVSAEDSQTVDFQLRISPLKHEITVTADSATRPPSRPFSRWPASTPSTSPRIWPVMEGPMRRYSFLIIFAWIVLITGSRPASAQGFGVIEGTVLLAQQPTRPSSQRVDRRPRYDRRNR